MTLLHSICGLMVAILWGGNFLAAKLSLPFSPPLFTMGARTLIAGALIVVFTTRPKMSFKKLYWLSFTQLVGHQGLLFVAVARGLDVATTVITSQLHVPITCLLGVTMLREQLHARQIIGMVIASMGIFMIVGSPHLAGHLTEVGLVVLAALFFAIFNIEIKQIGKFPRLALLGWASLIAAPQFFVLSFFLEQADFLKLQPLNITGTLSITYLIFSPIASFGLWFYLLQLYNINKVIPFAQLVPVFGVLSATLFLGEKLTPHMLIGGTMAISGVAIVAIKLPNKLLLAKKRLFD